jgi:hypothetical protein
MHMAWLKHVCGRLGSGFRYSNQIVYNNFPWPEKVTDAQRSRIEELAQCILDIRAECGDGRHGFLPLRTKRIASTLADLYDPLAMPPALAAAHTALDKAVDKCYRSDPFPSDRVRVEHLFALYEQLTAPLAPSARAKAQRRKSKAP